MEDFNALAAALGADIAGIRASLILSRDGLVLGAHPESGESDAKAAWIKLANLGDPERGFLQFGTDTWCYVRRGPYAAFVLAAASVRPGLVIDQMERVLLAAEEARADRSAIRAEAPTATPVAAPASKPRTPLHPEPKPDDAPVVIRTDEPVAAAAPAPAAEMPAPAASAEAAPVEAARPEPASAPEAPVDPAAREAPAGAPSGSRGVWATEGGDEENDAFSLAREFGQLLQDEQGGADG